MQNLQSIKDQKNSLKMKVHIVSSVSVQIGSHISGLIGVEVFLMVKKKKMMIKEAK